jgi:hemerythrin-like domain-containing protein
MVGLIQENRLRLDRNHEVDLLFLDTAVDFIRVYADKTHHGKEEDILFRRCDDKEMSPEDTQLMNELIDEHRQTRKMVGELAEARQKYAQGEDTGNAIREKLNDLAWIYPQHIEKEDAVFFPRSEWYFTEEELEKMLESFWEFDRKMIHRKYQSVVAAWKRD